MALIQKVSAGAWFAAAIVVAISFAAIGQEAPQEKQTETKTETQTQPVIVPDVTSALRTIFGEAVKIFRDEKAAGEESEKRKDAREEEDLVAQKRQARWAKYIGYIAAIQTFVGIITIIFLYRTFEQTKIAAKAAVTAAEHITRVERAFVGLSHVSDETEPGNPGLNPANQKVKIEVRNTGQTPAKVVGVMLGHVVVGQGQPLPPDMPLDGLEDMDAAQAFLHSNLPFFVRKGLKIPDHEWNAIQFGQKTLYVIGLVEYVDVFDVWHRAGYARRYAPGRAKNNLTFVTGDAYSYDIVIKESERLTGKQGQADQNNTGLS